MRCVYRICIYSVMCILGCGHTVSARSRCVGCPRNRAHHAEHQRVHTPHAQTPIYAAMYDSSVSEFARLLREYDIVTNLHVPITIFAPINVALSLQDIRGMEKGRIRQLLRRHIVAGYMLPDTLADGARLRNLEGDELVFARDGEDFTIADVDIHRHRETPHAVIYHIDGIISSS